MSSSAALPVRLEIWSRTNDARALRLMDAIRAACSDTSQFEISTGRKPDTLYIGALSVRDDTEGTAIVSVEFTFSKAGLPGEKIVGLDLHGASVMHIQYSEEIAGLASSSVAAYVRDMWDDYIKFFPRGRHA